MKLGLDFRTSSAFYSETSKLGELKSDGAAYGPIQWAGRARNPNASFAIDVNGHLAAALERAGRTDKYTIYLSDIAPNGPSWTNNRITVGDSFRLRFVLNYVSGGTTHIYQFGLKDSRDAANKSALGLLGWSTVMRFDVWGELTEHVFPNVSSGLSTGIDYYIQIDCDGTNYHVYVTTANYHGETGAVNVGSLTYAVSNVTFDIQLDSIGAYNYLDSYGTTASILIKDLRLAEDASGTNEYIVPINHGIDLPASLCKIDAEASVNWGSSLTVNVIEESDSEIKARFVASDTNYDLSNAGDRATLTALFGSYSSGSSSNGQRTFDTSGVSTGQYLYCQFQHNPSTDKSKPSGIIETGEAIDVEVRDTTPPVFDGGVSGVAATDLTTNRDVEVSCNAATDAAGSTTYYKYYYKAGDGEPFTAPDGTAAFTVNTAQNLRLPSNAEYSIGVRAIDDSGNETTNTDYVTVTATSETIVLPTSPTLSIDALTVGSTVTATVTGFDVGTTNEIFARLVAGTWPSTATATCNVSGVATMTLDPGTYYAYVKSSNDVGAVIGTTDPVKFVVTTAVRTAQTQDTLTHSPAEILQRYLIDEAKLAADVEVNVWPCFISTMPDGPRVADDCICVKDTTGMRNGRLMDGPNIYHHGVQIRVRCRNYLDGWAKAKAIESTLSAVARDTVVIDDSTYRLDNISQTSPVLPMGEEQGTKKRQLFSINILMSVKEV